MPSHICKLDGMYFVWSTVVDAPVTYGMTLEELTDYVRAEYGRYEVESLGWAARMKRVEAKGCSCHGAETVDELIAYNRAGPNESRLTKAEIIQQLKAAK